MSKLRTKDGVPVASDFAGHEPPLVEDFDSGFLYTINSSGVVAPVSGHLGDIRRFGAVGDGSTDNTTAINTAIAAHIAGEIPLVYIPYGNFLYSARITITAPVTIIGDGYYSVLTCPAASTFIFLLVEHPSFQAINGIRYSNFRIDANGSGQLDAGIVQLNNAHGFVVDRLWISGHSRASGSSGVNGIAMSAGTLGGARPNGSIKNCVITGGSKAAINCSTQTAGCDIVGNILYGNTGNGSTAGVQIFGGKRVRVRGNTIYSNEGPGVFVASDANNEGPEYALIDGNHIYGNGTGTSQGDGIAVQNAQAVTSGRIIIRGNHVHDNGVAVNASGILVQNEERVLIDGNYVYANSGNGVVVDYSTNTVEDVLIVNNVIENNNQDDNANGSGLFISGNINRLAIRGNKFLDTQGTPTQDWAVRADTSGMVNDFVLEDNIVDGQTNLVAYNLNNGMLFKRMRIRADWRVQTTDGSNNNGVTLSLADDSAVLMKSSVIAMQSGGSNRAAYERNAIVYRDGAGATIQGSVATPFTEESDATWDSTIVVGGNDVAPRVTGVAATTIDWRGTLEVVSI